MYEYNDRMANWDGPDTIDFHKPVGWPMATSDDNMADAYLGYLMGNSFKPRNYNIWIQKDGGEIAIVDMDERHIRNTIDMLRRNMIDGYYDAVIGPIARNYIGSLNRELKRRLEPFMENKIQNVTLNVAGVTFSNDNGTSRQQILSAMKKEDKITLKREPTNKYDRNAIAVFVELGTLGEHQVGYIGKEYAKIIADMMDREGRQFAASIQEVDRYKDNWYCKLLINEV